MRLRRKPRPHGRYGHPVIEIAYASTPSDGDVPIAYLEDGATREDAEYVRAWLRAMQTHGDSAEVAIEHQRTDAG